MTKQATSNLRVWWIPQVPMKKAFYVSVSSVAEGVKILDVLANYDLFQFENRVKGDYINVGGLQMFEDNEWVDWYDEESGDDDPHRWLAETPVTKKSIDVVRSDALAAFAARYDRTPQSESDSGWIDGYMGALIEIG